MQTVHISQGYIKFIKDENKCNKIWRYAWKRIGIRVITIACFLDGSAVENAAVKNPPSMQETQEVRFPSLGWEDPPGEGSGNPY